MRKSRAFTLIEYERSKGVSRKEGFTLIELMAAIFILTTGTVGAFSLIRSTLTFTNVISSQLTAVYLAQEGVEIIRNIRDSNWLEARTILGLPWDDGILAGTDYRLDYQSLIFPDSSPGNLCSVTVPLKYNSSTNYFNCYNSTNTIFRRKITITKPSSDRLSILVEVSFTIKGGTHKVTVQEDLYKWH